MTLPADTRLNDSPALGPLTAADFDTYQSPETAMLLHQDFVDTMAIPRRQTAPMDFRPASYEAAKADSEARLREKVVGARIGAGILLASAVLVVGTIAALAVLY